MRCLFLTQYYPPETGAAQNRLSDWAQRLSMWGHHVTVLTAVPNYPRGEIFSDYRGRWLYDEHKDGVRVLRTLIFVSPCPGFLQRLSSYISFMFASFVVAIAKAGPQDVIIVESPPLLAGISGLLLKYWFRAKMVLNVSDLWPESAVAMGMLHNRYLIWMSTRLEELLYRKAALVTGQTRHIVSSIANRTGVFAALVSNGVDLDAFIDPILIDRRLQRRRLGFSDEFVVGYAGLHGFAQGLDIILDAAEILHDFPGILFVLFGDGPDKSRLQQQAQARGLPNLRFYPPQPKQAVPILLACFDACVVPLRGLRLFRGALPCKLFECMASGAPVIVSIAGEAEDLVRDADGGLCIPPEDGRALADAILRLRDDPALGRILSQNARAYVARHYDRKDIAARLRSLLSPIAVSNR